MMAQKWEVQSKRDATRAKNGLPRYPFERNYPWNAHKGGRKLHCEPISKGEITLIRASTRNDLMIGLGLT